MKETKNVKALKKQLAAAIAMVCVAGVALGSSTYAWFVSNNWKITVQSSQTGKSTGTIHMAKRIAREEEEAQ